jgi:hypothetical protein
MSKEPRKTAEELMAALEGDPEYLQRKRVHNEKFQQLRSKYAELARPVLERLRGQGFEAETLEDLVRKYAPLPQGAVSIILECVEPGQDERHCESLIRALGATKCSFSGVRLAHVYDSTSDESLRWAIANTISLTRPHSIDEWIEKIPKHSTLRRALVKLGYFS